MTAPVYDELKDRGFIAQATAEEAMPEMLSKGITCYVGFDPTASALHVGHLLPIMAQMHMQRYGHQPIVLLGGGTAMIGDPSGKNEMRRILSREEIEDNAGKIKQQFSRYLDFADQILCVYPHAGRLKHALLLRGEQKHGTVFVLRDFLDGKIYIQFRYILDKVEEASLYLSFIHPGRAS